MFWLYPAIAAAAGLTKHFAVDQPREDRQRKMAAARTRWSPWTGLKPDPVQEADWMGTTAQFGLAGAQLGQNIETAAQQNELAKSQKANLDAETKWLDKGVSPNGTNRIRISGNDPRFQAGFTPYSQLKRNPAGFGF